MKNLRSKVHPPMTDLVQKFIDSAYDKVKLVADNLTQVLTVATALDDGSFQDWITEAEAQTLINGAVEGLYDHKGGWNAATNTPDLTTVAKVAISVGDAYVVTVAGSFFGISMEAGDLLIANIDDPVDETGWTLVNRNIDSSAFATAAQGLLADTALQASDVGSAAYQDTSAFATSLQGTKADSALQPGANISALTNDAGYTNDQTPAEIETAYNSVVPAADQAEAEAGTEAAIRRFSPLRIAQAILVRISKYLGQNLQTGTSYTLVLADAGKAVEMTNAAANTVTVPPNSTVAFPINTRIDIFQGGAGLTSIAAGTGVTLRGDLNSVGQWKGMSLWQRAVNEWYVIGGTA